jgi:hypothetical protein
VLPHATRELTELGLLDELDSVGIPTAEIAYYSTHGQRIWSKPRGMAAGYRWPQFSIHRGQLLGMLIVFFSRLIAFESVPPVQPQPRWLPGLRPRRARRAAWGVRVGPRRRPSGCRGAGSARTQAGRTA